MGKAKGKGKGEAKGKGKGEAKGKHDPKGKAKGKVKGDDLDVGHHPEGKAKGNGKGNDLDVGDSLRFRAENYAFLEIPAHFLMPPCFAWRTRSFILRTLDNLYGEALADDLVFRFLALAEGVRDNPVSGDREYLVPL